MLTRPWRTTSGTTVRFFSNVFSVQLSKFSLVGCCQVPHGMLLSTTPPLVMLSRRGRRKGIRTTARGRVDRHGEFMGLRLVSHSFLLPQSSAPGFPVGEWILKTVSSVQIYKWYELLGYCSEAGDLFFDQPSLRWHCTLVRMPCPEPNPKFKNTADMVSQGLQCSFNTGPSSCRLVSGYYRRQWTLIACPARNNGSSETTMG